MNARVAALFTALCASLGRTTPAPRGERVLGRPIVQKRLKVPGADGTREVVRHPVSRKSTKTDSPSTGTGVPEACVPAACKIPTREGPTRNGKSGHVLQRVGFFVERFRQTHK